ncbi:MULTISPECIES: hypothetical protein [unclassified Pseudoalteromonas]|uniref:hypothetical protein n=1 Tax=unclassified Pseudoalteromonas TaxID=194690 RepID=UPI000C089FBD|nr:MULTISPECIES: hypothetical protein [unclassified Pseudoalteromonas]MDP2635133.1 hypothetical protein [Pseudoalteromonas sp. 1_MG-2023]PHN91492.1 hypothetical protein CSC79_00145 [Pseudoalteromonas sp. 3D05]
MSLGRWDDAILKSLLYVGIGIAVWALFANLAPLSINGLFGLVVTLLLYAGVYLLISIAGWLIIGFPLHFLISKYTNRSYLYYAALPMAFVLPPLYYKGSLLLGLAALFQALIFRFYVYKKV